MRISDWSSDVCSSDLIGAGLFHVTNDLALDGQLSVTAGLGYGQGIYRLFDYDGTLTDGGLDIAAMPTGTTGQIQTSVAQQVNLVVAGGQNPDPEPGAVPDIQLWNGTTTVANGMVNGGSEIGRPSRREGGRKYV